MGSSLLILAGVIIGFILSQIGKGKRKQNFKRKWTPEQELDQLEFDTGEAEKENYYTINFDFSIFSRRRVFTNNEQDFFRILHQTLNGKYHILSKVRLLDILRIDEDLKYKDRGKYWAAFNRVTKLHLDFILISKDKHYIECIIELDDKSHSIRKERDDFLNAIIQSINFPFIRIPARANGTYSHEYIMQHLQKVPTLQLASSNNTGTW
jgi:hypothetical protein